MALPDSFLTQLPNGNTLGDEALIPTRSYVKLVDELLKAGVDIHTLLPGTGSGVAKVAFAKRPFTYTIYDWPGVPMLFQYMRSIGVSIEDCLTTFNWGVGYYIFVPVSEVERTLNIGRLAGYSLSEIGVVGEGERKVVFGPENNLVLRPPE